MQSTTSPPADGEDNRVFATLSEAHLRATWRHAVRHNIVDCSDGDKQLLLDITNSWPDQCVVTNIESASTTTKRGKRPRAYPRKGVVKLSTDLKASKQKIGLHQLAAYIRGGRIPRVGEQASHFGCDNDRCVNPGHIVFEDASANASRYCCKLFKTLPQFRCPHQPCCPGAQSCFA